MKLYFKNILLFIAFFLLLVISILGILAYKTDVTFNEMPAPRFSNSISFNEKIYFAANENSRVLAIGSSMTLNNLDSKTIIDSLQSNSYLNLGSWGLNIEEMFELLKLYSSEFTPKFLIVSSSIHDFNGEAKEINYKFIESYIKRSPTLIYYFLKSLNARFFIDNLITKKRYQDSNNMYESLKFDSYGAVLFDTINFYIKESRWNDSVVKEGFQTNYMYLKVMSDYCKQKNIKLLFFQSPCRQGIVNTINNNYIFQKHIKNVKKIVNEKGHYYINANEKLWPDSLFVDAYHFNAKGARMYTQYCLNQYNQLKSQSFNTANAF